MNWSKVLDSMSVTDVQSFATGDTSFNAFYGQAVKDGIGPEIRVLKTRGAARARKSAREALRRRGALSS